jgi:hypothetical protein
MERKRGKLSLEEMKFIDENAHKYTIEDIAVQLNRTTEPVKRYIQQRNLAKFGMSDDEHLLLKLHDRYYWPELAFQFDEEELRFFEYKWIEYYRQFAEDVTATEENEMLELIRVSILINRVMRDKQDVVRNVKRIERLIDIEMDKPPHLMDTITISNLQQQLGGLIASKAAFIKEYDTLTNKLEKFTKDLKGTRETRLKKSEDAKTNFNAMVRYLEEENVRRREGYEMEKHAIAADKAVERLGAYHEYIDGTVDQPFLNDETIMDEEESP